MLSLLRKDIDWLIIATLIGVITVTAIFVDHGFIVTWITHRNDLMMDLFLGWSILGLIAGLFSGLRDDLFGTRDYLRQRPISQTRLFWTKNFWSFVMMSTWLIIPLIAVTIWPMAFPDNRSIAEYGRFINYAALASVMISNYAIGYFTASARGNILLRITQGAIVTSGVWTFTGLAMTKSIALTPTEFTASQVGIAAVLFFAASQSECQNRDEDMPAPRRAGVLQVLILSISVFWVVGTLSGVGQAFLVADLLSEYPKVGRSLDGEFSMVKIERGRRRGEENTYVFVDENHRHTNKEFDGGRRKATVRSLSWSLGGYGDDTSSYDHNDHGWNALRFQYGLGFNREFVNNTSGRYWFDRSAGEVIEYVIQGWESKSQRPHVERSIRSDGKRFALNTQAHNLAIAHDLLIFRDNSDHTIWIKSTKEPGDFRPLSLPNEDQFLALLRHRWPIRGHFGTFKSSGPGFKPIILGESGKLYKLEGRVFEPIPLDSPLVLREPKIAASEIDPQSHEAWGLNVVKYDPITPEFIARGINPTNEARFKFSPRTAKERRIASSIFAMALTRPVLSHIAGFLTDDTGFSNRFQMDSLSQSSLFTGKKRLGLLVFFICLSLLLAWHQRIRLLRFGASAFTANMWALAIILAGPLLAILVVFMERPRAYAPVTILKEEDAPPCLLKSA